MNTVTKFAILNANYPAGAGRLVSSLAPPEWPKLGKIGGFLRKMAKSDASAGSFHAWKVNADGWNVSLQAADWPAAARARTTAASEFFIPHATPQKTTGGNGSEGLFDSQHPSDMKITDVLRAEHAVFHNLFDHIEAVLPRTRTLAEVKSLTTVVETLLAPHTKTEDDLFMEPLEHCFDQIGQQETFHDEHRMIDAELAKVHQARDLKSAKKILLDAVTASRKHFDKEERIVFPMAERILKTKTLSELGETWLKRRAIAVK
jgi:hemerythrin-like domain-containing protein